MGTPVENGRLLYRLVAQAETLQRDFQEYDKVNNVSRIGNALYLTVQAADYLHTMQRAVKYPDDAGAYTAHAKSELSRILALALRECVANDWDFMEVLSEGVEYETDTLTERGPETAKFLEEREK